MSVKKKWLARIHPYDFARGYVTRRYLITVDGNNWLFDERRNWYEVTERCAKKLKEIRTNEADPESKLVFDVCTQEEALAVDFAEKLAEMPKAGPNNPIPIPSSIDDEEEVVEEQEDDKIDDFLDENVTKELENVLEEQTTKTAVKKTTKRKSSSKKSRPKKEG